MADETGPGAEIPENQLVARLISAGAANATALRGYFGPTTTEGRVTLYPSLDDLSESFEIARDDILAFEAAPDSVLPNGGMIVWVKKDAEVTHRRAQTVKIQAQNLAEVRKGRLRILMPVPNQLWPVCRSRCFPGCLRCQSRCLS